MYIAFETNCFRLPESHSNRASNPRLQLKTGTKIGQKLLHFQRIGSRAQARLQYRVSAIFGYHPENSALFNGRRTIDCLRKSKMPQYIEAVPPCHLQAAPNLHRTRYGDSVQFKL